MRKTICVDCETGGLIPYDSGICSVTLKVVGEDKIKTIFIKPTKNRIYDKKAFEINGLSIEMLEEKGVSEKEAIYQIIEFINKHAGFKPNFLAHNAIFDLQFLNVLFYRHSKKMFTEYIWYHPFDTMIMMKLLSESGVINITSVNLTNSYKYFFGEEFQDAHTSEGDVLATEKVFLKIIELMNNCSG